MSDRTNFQLYVHSTTPADAAKIADFIAYNSLGLDYSPNWNNPTPIEIYLGQPYGDNEASLCLADDTVQLAEDAPDTAFVAWTDPKYEYLGMVVVHVPGMGVFSANCDSDGNPVLTRQTITDVLDDQPDDMTVGEFRKVLDQHTGRAFFDALPVLETLPNSHQVKPVSVPVATDNKD